MKDKTILITGASRGLGLALVRRWQHDNAIVALARTRSAEWDPRVHFFECDLADERATTASMQAISKQFRTIDLVINNAALLTSRPLGVMGTQEIGRMIDVNLKAPILISKAMFRKMIQARSGQIINILSMAPRVNAVGDSVYAATKSGLEAFARILNREGHPFGVHVNNIGLSAFPTGMLDQILGENKSKVIDLIPHKQFAPLDEVIAAIEFFVANSRDVGGQTLYFGGV